MPDSDVREDCDKLLKILVPVAKQLLEVQGEFYPFAGIVTADGQAQIFAADIGKKNPTPSEMVEFLTDALRAQNSKCRAAAICTDVLFPSPNGTGKTNGIQLLVEHNSGIAMTVIVPYVKADSGTILLGNIYPVESKPLNPIFGKGD